MPGTERKPEQEEWITLPAAAAALHCTRTKVLADAVKGELEADHRGPFVFISRKSIDALLARRAAKGKGRAKKAPRSRQA